MFPTCDPASGAGGDIDVVEADGVVADDPETRPGGVEERVVHSVGEQGQDAVAPGDAPEQLIAGWWELVLPEVHVACRGDRFQALIRDASGHEDPRPLAHTRAATSGSTTVRMRASASVRFFCELAYEIRMWSSP